MGQEVASCAGLWSNGFDSLDLYLGDHFHGILGVCLDNRDVRSVRDRPVCSEKTQIIWNIGVRKAEVGWHFRVAPCLGFIFAVDDQRELHVVGGVEASCTDDDLFSSLGKIVAVGMGVVVDVTDAYIDLVLHAFRVEKAAFGDLTNLRGVDRSLWACQCFQIAIAGRR